MKIGRNPHGGYRHEHSPYDFGPLLLEDFGHVALNLFGDLLLACSFHISVIF